MFIQPQPAISRLYASASHHAVIQPQPVISRLYASASHHAVIQPQPVISRLYASASHHAVIQLQPSAVSVHWRASIMFIQPQPAISRLYAAVSRHDVYSATARAGRLLCHRQPDRHITFIQYQLGRDTFSFFCDSGEQLEILNFLPDIQDLGLTACRCQKHRSPKRCLSVPIHKACRNARASGTGPSAATAWK